MTDDTNDPTAPSPAQVYRIFLKASADEAWAAITRPEFTRRYFYGASVETTAEEGTPFRYRAPDGETLWGDETVLESDPPRRLVVGWRSLFDPDAVGEPPSRVTWELESRGERLTMLTVVHDRLERSPRTAKNVEGAGWMMVLSGLKTLLETGAGITE